MIRILTDSTADLTPELIGRFGLTVIPLYVRFGEEILRDGVDLTQQEFQAKIKSSPDFPKTAQPTPADFIEIIQPMLAAGDEVIYVGLSSDLSGTHASAILAAEQLGDVPLSLLDSRNLSMGIGLLAIKASQLAGEGRPRSEIVELLQQLVKKTKTAFVVDKLDYLHKGGRLSTFQAVMGNILNIHPIIAVIDGRLNLAKKARGSHERALEEIFAFCLPEPERVKTGMVSVTHCGCPEDARFLAERVRKVLPEAEVVITEAGAVIGSHCGPPTVGILYIDEA